MTNNESAIQYANALCQLAQETNEQANLSKDTEELINVLVDDDAGFIQFFQAKSVAKEDKKKVVTKIFDQKINLYLVNLLKYLVDNSDERLLLDILIKFKEILNQNAGIVKVNIYTPFNLKDEDLKKILQKIEQQTKCQAQSNVIIDPKLIGGIKVEYNNIVYNNSIKNKLDLIKNNLRKK